MVQTNPYLWKFAWKAIHRIPFLLPHDKSYLALRHFILQKPEGLFVDVGANDGISALSFRRLSNNYQILSFEPNQLLAPALNAIKNKDHRFDYRMVGAGFTATNIQFLVPVYRSVVLHTFTSSSKKQIFTSVKDAFGQSVAEKLKFIEVNAEVVPLDSLNIKPSIIKIDAEGFDYDVLLGSEATIKQYRPFLMIEIAWANRSNILNFFSENDYVPCSYDIKRNKFNRYFDEMPTDETGARNIFGLPAELSHKLISNPVI
jgi:FkbM family methyltransferase